jgi:hypothetical protein
MSPELPTLEGLAVGFGRQWYEAPDDEAREMCRRSYLMCLILLAEQAGEDPPEELNPQVVAFQSVVRTTEAARLKRLWCASVKPVRKRKPSPDNFIEVLSEMGKKDGYTYNYDIPVH